MIEGQAFSHVFFRVDLRTHHLSCLDMATPEDGRKTAHDIMTEGHHGSVWKASSKNWPSRASVTARSTP